MAVTVAAVPLSGGRGVPAALCRGVHVLYEVLLQSSLLVTCVVTFVLMPARIRQRPVGTGCASYAHTGCASYAHTGCASYALGDWDGPSYTRPHLLPA